MAMQQGLRALMGQPPTAGQPPVDKNRLALATDVVASDSEKAMLEPPTLALLKYKDAVDAIKAADGIMSGMNNPEPPRVADKYKMQAAEGVRALAERLSPGLQTRGKQIQTAQARKMMGGLPMTRAQGGIIGFSQGGTNQSPRPTPDGQPTAAAQDAETDSINTYIGLYRAYEASKAAAKTPEEKQQVEQNFKNTVENFDSDTKAKAHQKMSGIQKFNQGTEVRGVGSFYRDPETGESLPISDRFKKLLMSIAGPRFKEEAEASAQPPAPREVTVEPREGGAGDPDAEEVQRTGIIDMLRRPQPDPGFVMPGVNPTGGRTPAPRRTTEREDLTTELLQVLGQPLATPPISAELEAMRPDLLAAEQTMLDPDRPARERERISQEARDAYAVPQELIDLVSGRQEELDKPLYTEKEAADRRIDAALAGLASSNLAAQAGPRALAGRRKVDDDMAQFARENAKEAFELGTALIEKDMVAGQNAFAAGLEAQKTANGQLTAAMQTLSSRLTGADNIAFNRALQQRQQEVASITTQLEQLNKAEQLDVQERQLLVNIGRTTATNLSSLRTMRKNLQDQFAIVADREDQTQANEIRQLMRLVDGQIAAEQSNLDFINSRFGLEVAPSSTSGITGGSPDLPAGFVED